MRCPVCKKPAIWRGNPFRPFCSERCKLVDLDNWLSERYRIAGVAEDEPQSEPAAAQPEPPAAEEEHG